MTANETRMRGGADRYRLLLLHSSLRADKVASGFGALALIAFVASPLSALVPQVTLQSSLVQVALAALAWMFHQSARSWTTRGTLLKARYERQALAAIVLSNLFPIPVVPSRRDAKSFEQLAPVAVERLAEWYRPVASESSRGDLSRQQESLFHAEVARRGWSAVGAMTVIAMVITWSTILINGGLEQEFLLASVIAATSSTAVPLVSAWQNHRHAGERRAVRIGVTRWAEVGAPADVVSALVQLKVEGLRASRTVVPSWFYSLFVRRFANWIWSHKLARLEYPEDTP